MELFDYQQEIFDRFKDTNRCAIYAQVGTGKTIMAKALLEHWNADNVIVLSVKLDKEKWCREIDGIDIKSGAFLEKNLDAKRMVLTHQLASTKLTQIVENMIGTIAIVCDESHKAKNSTSKLAKALLKHKNDFDYRILLSGTPIAQNYMDIYSQMKFTFNDNEMPYHFRTKTAFQKRYAIMGIPKYLENIIKAPQVMGWKKEHEQELLSAVNLVAAYAEAEEVLKLPDKHDIDVFVDYGEEFKQVSKTLKEEHYLTKKNGEDIFFDSLGGKLFATRKLRSGIIDNDVMFKDKFVETLKIIKKHKQGVIIFCEFRSEADYLVQAIEHCFEKQVGRIYGDYMEIDNEFVTICTYSKASESIDSLQLRNNIFIHFAPTNHYVKYFQARGRIWRNGQQKECYYYRLIAKGFEEKNYTALQNKQNYEINLKENWKEM